MSSSISGNVDKVRENRLRRMAERRGLRLEKSRRRDTRALDYGTYGLVDPAAGQLIAGSTSTGYGLSLDEVEKALNDGTIGYEAASDYISHDNEAEARGELDERPASPRVYVSADGQRSYVSSKTRAIAEHFRQR